jgi:hypothetical protein
MRKQHQQAGWLTSNELNSSLQSYQLLIDAVLTGKLC